ncbi:MAG TPA: galactose oxidase-like domain-containing protein [Candidatus Binatia bacterium]|nr:galactose oxidase-like domain-containing protein [Candidatus Binatia bacterium]
MERPGAILRLAAALACALSPAARAAHAGLLDGLLGGGGACTPASCGAFGAAFAEPTIAGVPTASKCITGPDGQLVCKPAAGSLALLADGRVLYWDALEGTERVQFSVVVEFGNEAANDQSRVLTIGSGDTPSWKQPTPPDGGANPGGTANTPLLPGLNTNDVQGAGALFCADLVQLADGRILAAGGTNYYLEPGVEPVPYGVIELEGLKNTRIFNPADDHWAQTDSMAYGRWYPTLVTLPDGDVFAASGVTKLVKPVYPEQPFNSGRNVVQTETFDVGCGKWSENGALAERSLPTYPRLHLLPNGQVFYNAGGQAFDPFGYGYDMALWNVVASYDPSERAWSDLAYAGLPLELNQVGLDRLVSALNPTSPLLATAVAGALQGLVGTVLDDPAALVEQIGRTVGFAVEPSAVEAALGSGFRGSTFSVMLPLEPDASGSYARAELLTAGGVLGAVVAPSPGTYLASTASRIDTVTVESDGLHYRSRLTGDLTQPRWFSTAVLLPDGSVMAFSGADRDEVVSPGLGVPVQRAERFDPATETWSPMATAGHPRTYHNTAMLLPDGRVLVGGHAPINTAYLFSISLPGFSPNDGRDPSFEIYSPPYALRVDRPAIGSAPDRVRPGQTFTIATPQAGSIAKVFLVRRTAMTHLIDADQRMVSLRIVARGSGSLRVAMPASPAVVPPGPYMIFVVRGTATGLVPSVSRPTTVLGADATCGGT